MLMVLTAGN